MKDLPLKQMDEQENDDLMMDQDKYRESKGFVPELMDQDEYREAKGLIPPIDSDRYRSYQPPADTEMESDIEKFVGRERAPVSDTVKYRKPINEAQGRVSDWSGTTKAQESIQK
jgi:hypothetical protein